jgi:hypothetical protein
MKSNTTIRYLFFISIVIAFSSCSVLPFLKQTQVAKNPTGEFYTTLNNFDLDDGYPSRRTWWVAYSDRINNTTTLGQQNEIPHKKLSFLEPMYITKMKGDYVKVVQYIPDLDLSAKRGRVDKKTLKSLGWIKKDKLLLWTTALKDRNSGFFAKAITCVASSNVIKNSTQFINTNDSLILFTTPRLTTKSAQSIPLGTVVYIYKQSDDRKSCLIGNTERTTPENVKQVLLGWVSADVLSIWGTRAGFTMAADSLKKIENNNIGLYATASQALSADSPPLLAVEKMETRNAFENIFPIQNKNIRKDSILKTSYLENILDYSKNKVLNVLGNPIYYPEYKNIIRNGQKLNIVFVIDGGNSNQVYFPSIKAILQDLQVYFDTTTLFKSHHFGAVVYKQAYCNNSVDDLSNTLPLTGDYNDIVNFIDQKKKELNCEDEMLYQPLYKGITDACNLLEPVKDETNIIVLIGTTGNYSINDYNLSNAIASITKVKARLMLFQSISKASNAYNDFVLEAEKAVINSARNLGELKKEKMVEINDIITNASYNLIAGDSGVYFLDYPNKSMIQGFVLFPKKGEAMQPRALKQNFETLLEQIVADNKKINSTLRSYFRSIGIKTTFIKEPFSNYFDSVPTLLPDNFSKSFINEQNGFFIPAYIQGKVFYTAAQIPEYGIFLSEDEYDRVIQQFYSIYQSTIATEVFRRRRAYRRYRSIVKSFMKENKITSKTPITQMTAAETLYLLTGYVSADSLSNNITISSFKKDPKLSEKTLLTFYYRFKTAADILVENKNSPQTKIYFGDKAFYWANKKLMP